MGIGSYLLVFKEGVNEGWNISEVALDWEEAKCSCEGRYVADDIDEIW
jgi:hypothetical protein